MKKIIVALAIVAGTFAISGCSGPNGFSNTYADTYNSASKSKNLPSIYSDQKDNSYGYYPISINLPGIAKNTQSIVRIEGIYSIFDQRNLQKGDALWNAQQASQRAEDFCTRGSQCYSEKLQKKHKKQMKQMKQMKYCTQDFEKLTNFEKLQRKNRYKGLLFCSVRSNRHSIYWPPLIIVGEGTLAR